MTDISANRPIQASSHHATTETVFLKLHDLACDAVHSSCEIVKTALRPVATFVLDKVAGKHGDTAASILLGARALTGVASCTPWVPPMANLIFDGALFCLGLAASDVSSRVAPEHREGLSRFKGRMFTASCAGGMIDACLGVGGGGGSVLAGIVGAAPATLGSYLAYRHVRNSESDAALRRDPKTQYTTERLAEASFTFPPSRLGSFIGNAFGERVVIQDGMQDGMNFGQVVLAPGWGYQMIDGRKQQLDANEVTCIRDACLPLLDQLTGPAEQHRHEAIKHVVDSCNAALVRLERRSPSPAAQ